VSGVPQFIRINFEAREWMIDAACRDTTVDMFPEDISGVYLAKNVCHGCRVRATCLAYALDYHEVFGVWGGTSQRERRRIWKLRGRSVA
jgi:WhiB family redox-sensing transcriptional regulator